MKTSKTTIIVIIVVIVAIIGYFYYAGTAPASSASDLVGSAADQSVGSTELSLLNQVQSLSIDPSLFQDPAYQTLQDYTVPIPQENVGRPNPFAPLPGQPLVLTTVPSSNTGH